MSETGIVAFQKQNYTGCAIEYSTLALLSLFLILVSKVAQGNFGERINVSRSDEMGELVGSFNYMLQQLTQIEQQNHNLIAAVSHELRSPLARIRVNAELLGLSFNMNNVVPHTKAICNEVDHLNSIVSDLLSSARMRKETFFLKYEFIDVVNFLKEVIKLYSNEESLRNIRINFNTIFSKFSLHIDRRLMKQVMTNIIDNAITAIKQSGTIEIKMHSDSGFIVITITDDGPGIEMAHQRLIFDRFYRIDASGTSLAGSIGLGLTIAKQIIELHNGHIDLCSNPGEGCTFSVFLPNSDCCETVQNK